VPHATGPRTQALTSRPSSHAKGGRRLASRWEECCHWRQLLAPPCRTRQEPAQSVPGIRPPGGLFNFAIHRSAWQPSISLPAVPARCFRCSDVCGETWRYNLERCAISHHHERCTELPQIAVLPRTCPLQAHGPSSTSVGGDSS
jgi:hypothetical protein